MKAKYYMHLTLVLFALGIVQPVYTAARGQSENTSPHGTEDSSPIRLISLDLKEATLADVVEEIGRKYRVPIIADCFVNDSKIKRVRYNEAPLTEVIRSLAYSYGRDSRYINGIVVLRASALPIRVKQEQTAIRSLGFQWVNDGYIKSVRYMDDTEKNQVVKPANASTNKSESKDDSVPPAIKFRAQADNVPALKIPARFISLEAKYAPAFKVVRAINASSGWTVALETPLEERRLSAFIHQATPGQVLEAITFMLSASQRTTIGQTDTQKMVDAELLDTRHERIKMTEVLISQLASSLTKEQRQQIAQGKQVTLPMSAIPSNVRALAETYIKQSYSIISSPSSLDFSRLGDFAIVFVPGMPTLGVDGYLKDGTPTAW